MQVSFSLFKALATIEKYKTLFYIKMKSRMKSYKFTAEQFNKTLGLKTPLIATSRVNHKTETIANCQLETV